LVTQLAMANAASSFQNMVNDIFKDMIDLGIITYVDDILIDTQTKEEYVKLVKEGPIQLKK
jgi:hypothetical protein